MQSKIKYGCLFILLLLLMACEEQIFPVTNQEPELVVEGYIEGGEIPTPPYLLLTRSVGYSENSNQISTENLFVHDAVITVSDGVQTVTLTELCWEDLTEAEQNQALEFFGATIDSVGLNICIYLDRDLTMMGEIGKTYELTIEAEGQVLTSQTTVPPHVPLDSAYFKNRPGDNSPDFFELIAKLSDPPGQVDFYRYFTSTNGSIFAPPLSSVADDAVFDGQDFEFPLAESELEFEDDIAPADYGFFQRGDTILLRWTNLDEAHYNFWNTVEFNSLNQGPFGSYTVIDGNIEGGLGIWGGYSNSYYEWVVE